MTKLCCLEAKITLIPFHLGSHWWHLFASLHLHADWNFLFPNQPRAERKPKSGPESLLAHFMVVCFAP